MRVVTRTTGDETVTLSAAKGLGLRGKPPL
jgi:hypothetical protein